MVRIRSRISAGVMPEAYAPATSPPMLVPAIMSMGIWCPLEPLEHADVREPAGAAAAERQPDARTRLRLRRRRRRLIRLRKQWR